MNGPPRRAVRRFRVVTSLAEYGRTKSGAVAQWSEQGTHNPWVVGSIPTRPTSWAFVGALYLDVRAAWWAIRENRSQLSDGLGV